MSEAALDPQQADHEAAIVQIVEGREPIDAKLLAWSDWLNPILVKESRQALKSRQFQWTFILLLLGVIGWTTTGVALLMPGIYYLPAGPQLMIGYFLILLVPVCVMVPMSAFRSMASELDEGTHDILSLSALTSKQIVLGKLMVAMLQSLIYFSALTPCIAVTYLLRGLSLGVIFVIILGTFGLSLLFTCLAILFATIGRTRELQVLMTLLLFLAFVPSLVFFISFVVAMISQQILDYSQLDTWLGVGLAFVVALSYAWLMLLAASAKIGFAVDNHSTRLRWMLYQQHWMILTIGCIHSLRLSGNTQGAEIWIVYLSWLAAHWGVAGTLMIGERGDISPRARRTIPTSGAGRMLLSWFNPGGGPGYLLAVGSMLSATIFMVFLFTLDWPLNQNGRPPVIEFSAALTGYVALYLGMLRLISLAIGRHLNPRMAGLFAVQFLLIATGVGISLFLPAWQSNYQSVEYEHYCFMNFFWTLERLIAIDTRAEAALFWVFISALLVFGINILFVTRDILIIRIATPPRVLQETGQKLDASEPLDPLAAD